MGSFSLLFDVAMKLAPLALLVLAAACAACAPLTPAPRGEVIHRNLVYAHRATGDEHLDLYLPATQPPYPTVMWIHGGGWKFGDKGWMLYLRKLTRDGFAIASVQYRLSGTARYPAQFEDCRDAFGWLRAEGPRYGLRSNHLFLAGASAGGHLAALLGVKEGRARVSAVCVMYPATNLTGFQNQDRHRGYLPELLGGSVNEKRALAESGSPVRFVTRKAPPFLFFHGDHDALVPVAQSEDLDRRLRAAGVESHLIVLRGQAHGFPLDDEQLQRVAAFFRQHDHPSR